MHDGRCRYRGISAADCQARFLTYGERSDQRPTYTQFGNNPSICYFSPRLRDQTRSAGSGFTSGSGQGATTHDLASALRDLADTLNEIQDDDRRRREDEQRRRAAETAAESLRGQPADLPGVTLPADSPFSANRPRQAASAQAAESSPGGAAACDADLQRALQRLRANANTCAVNSANLISEVEVMPVGGTGVPVAVISRSRNPWIFAVLPPEGDPRWRWVDKHTAVPRCMDPVVRTQQEAQSECFRVNLCGIGHIQCARQLIRSGVSCQAAVQRCKPE